MYTAFEKMRTVNNERYGLDAGPLQPRLLQDEEHPNDLKSAALRFLHERCEGLLFDPDIEETEDRTGVYQGTSIRGGQIPYNMEKDINRLCLEKELGAFIDSGVAEDAYDIYYCFLEIFFGRYGTSKKMVELLSEFESNGSSLLMKHRDHYSHSVYVFALGLAIYETNREFRRIFKEFYHFNPDESDQEADHEAANMFLKYWGLTSLFHDIGYPFELPFEQVMSYFEVEHKERGDGRFFLAFHSVSSATAIGENGIGKKVLQDQLKTLTGNVFQTTDELFAFWITKRLGEVYDIEEERLRQQIHDKPIHPELFNYYMDHAWFSSVRLYHEIIKALGVEAIDEPGLDALTAILMHNSLYKFCIAFYKDDDRKPSLKAELHPLAYLLMLCDELQCWDRTAYGRNSRTELHPMAARFDFSDQKLSVTYYYDQEEQAKIDDYLERYRTWEADGKPGKAPKLKAYSSMAEPGQSFRTDIESIVDTSIIPLHVETATSKVDRHSKHIFLSDSNFLHLYDFAVALNARYSYQGREKDVSPEQLEAEFEELSLEYQLSNIEQAKSFSKYLNAIQCFYTDRPVDFDMVTSFTPEQIAVFAPMEHLRWVREHEQMGWKSSEVYETVERPADVPPENEKQFRKDLREQLRCHKLAMAGRPADEEVFRHYEQLSEEDQGKDWKPFRSMLELIRKFDGLRIYRLN